MISILLPCYKSERLLREVFLRSALDDTTHEIVFYNNGGNGSFFSGRPKSNWKFIGDGVNVGLNKALNACARAAQYDYFYLSHTDMMLHQGWDTALLNQAKKLAPGSFMLCSRSCEVQQSHTPFHIHLDYGDELETFRPDDFKRDFADYKDSGIVTGYRMPFFLDRFLWRKMNGVDENYFSYAQDNDIFMSAYHVGVRRFWLVNQSLVYHLQGKSNKQQNVDRDSDAPYAYFRKKWKALGYNTDLHIDKLEQSLIPWNNKVA